MKTETPQRGGKRPGAGRPPEGKAKFTVTLTAANVAKAKAGEANFSGLLDSLLAQWLLGGTAATPRPVPVECVTSSGQRKRRSGE